MTVGDSIFSQILSGPTPNLELLRRDQELRRDNWPHGGYLYRGGGDFLLQHGILKAGRAIPERFAHHVGGESECFQNAWRAAKAEPDLRYCEGVWLNHHGSVCHAWCLDPDDEVVEVTWPTRPEDGLDDFSDAVMRMALVRPERLAYFGAVFTTDLIDWFVETYGEVCLFDRTSTDRENDGKHGLDMHQSHDWPVLKVPYDPARTSF